LTSGGVEVVSGGGRVGRGGWSGGRIETTTFLRLEVLLDEGDR